LTVKVQVLQNPNPTVVEVDYVELFQQMASVQKVTDLDKSSPNNAAVVTGITGQLNTPVTKYGDYLYFAGFGGDNYYYQYNLSTNTLKHYQGVNTFYWAGAAVVSANNTEYVVFGGDNSGDGDSGGGYLYYRSVADFEGTGGTYDLKTFLPASDDHVPGNVRSSISKDDTYLYFTTQGSDPRGAIYRQGYLWRAEIANITNLTANTVRYAAVTDSGGDPNSATSTPALSENGIIYVGTYQGGTSSGGITAFDQSSLTKLRSLRLTLPTDELNSSAVSLGAVQSSPIVWSDGEVDYVYVTTNVSGGRGYCYSFDREDLSSPPVKGWESPGNTFALQGFASDNGYLVYGNDNDRIYIISAP
jgi:hypothetical protein